LCHILSLNTSVCCARQYRQKRNPGMKHCFRVLLITSAAFLIVLYTFLVSPSLRAGAASQSVIGQQPGKNTPHLFHNTHLHALAPKGVNQNSANNLSMRKRPIKQAGRWLASCSTPPIAIAREPLVASSVAARTSALTSHTNPRPKEPPLNEGKRSEK
jgi:hypothetical protein